VIDTSNNKPNQDQSAPESHQTGTRPPEREDGRSPVHCYTIGCRGVLSQFACEHFAGHQLGVLFDDSPDLRIVAARTRPGVMALEKDYLRRGDKLLLWSLSDTFSTLADLTYTVHVWLERGVEVWIGELRRQLDSDDLRLLRAATFSQRTRRGQGCWRLPPNPRRFVGYGLLAKYNRSKRTWSFRHDAAARSAQDAILSYGKFDWSTREIATALNLSGIRTWGRVCQNSGMARNKRVRWTPQRVAIARNRELELREFERNPAAYERALQKDADRLP
jgi:hypothetical protein